MDMILINLAEFLFKRGAFTSSMLFLFDILNTKYANEAAADSIKTPLITNAPWILEVWYFILNVWFNLTNELVLKFKFLFDSFFKYKMYSVEFPSAIVMLYSEVLRNGAVANGDTIPPIAKTKWRVCIYGPFSTPQVSIINILQPKINNKYL